MTVPVSTSEDPRFNPGRVDAADLAHIATVTQPLKARIRELLELRPGLRVLDVGCGPGLDAVAVAARISPGGRVVGLDYDPSQLDAARRRSSDVQGVAFAAADAAAIPSGDGAFDRTYSERVLQHCAAAESVVAEMVRVTTPGGVVVLADADWATLSIDTPLAAAERALVRFVGDTLRNGYAGRQLRRLLIAQQCTDVTVEVCPIVWTDYQSFRATSFPVLDLERRAVGEGAVSAAALARFQDSLAASDRQDGFFASAAIMIARGRAPRRTARGDAEVGR